MHASLNRFELEAMSKIAAQAYLDGNRPLNQEIAKIAGENDLSEEQIKRVVEGANTLVNGALVVRARDEGGDPRVTFDRADSQKIAGLMDTGTMEAEALRKQAEISGLFSVEPEVKTADLDRTVGKTADDPYADIPKSVDHMKLATDLLAGQDPGSVTTASLSMARQVLEDLRHQATSDLSLAKEAMFASETGLRQQINDLLLTGTSTATVRDVIKHAGLDDKTSNYVDGLVTKVAAGLSAREGQSSLIDGSIVNKNHPLVSGARAVMENVEGAVKTARRLDKITTVCRHADDLYAEALENARG